jgi:protein disulfide-isomerase-like protein
MILQFLLTLYAVQAAFYSKKSGVINLDIDNFEEQIKNAPVCMVEFYAPWCGHCKQLQPIYVKLAKELGASIPVMALDASEEKNAPIAQAMQIQGFPTLMIFVDGKPEPYQGARDFSSMAKALRSKLPNKVTVLGKKKADKAFKKNKGVKAVLLHKKSSTPDAWKTMALLFENHIDFYESRKDKDFAKKYGVKLEKSAVLVFEKGAKKPQIYDGLLKVRMLKKYLRKFAPDLDLPEEEKLPVISDQSCFQKFCLKKGLCVLTLLGEDASDAERVGGVVKEFEQSDDRASLFGFGSVSIATHYEWVSKVFPDKLTDYSHLVVLHPKKMRYASYVGSFSYATVQSFISGILTGSTRTSAIRGMEELPSFSTETENCKKEPEPEPKPQQQQQKPPPRQGPPQAGEPGGGSEFIIHATEADFDAIVTKSTQPSIVEFYAPWCGHCKQLAPAYAKAASNLKGMVQFVSVDCTVEQGICQKLGVQGYPTIKIFQDGKARDYQSGRSAKAFRQVALDLLTGIDVESYTSDSIGDFESADGVKLLFFTDKDKIPSMVKALVARYPSASIGVVKSSESEVCEKFGVSEFPAILQVSDSNVNYDGEKKFPALCEWVESLGAVKFASKPKVINIPEISSAEQWTNDVAKKVSMTVIAMFDDAGLQEARDGSSEAVDILKQIAVDNPDAPFRFAYMGKSGQGRMMEVFDLEEDIEVDLVIVNPKKKRFVVFEGDFTKPDVETWIKSVKAGQVKTTKEKKFPIFGESASDKTEL